MAPNKPCHVRSSSLPSSSHPVAIKVEEELRELSSSMAASSSSTTETVHNGLRILGGLYESVKELICATSCQRSLVDPTQQIWLEEQLDESISLLDLCSTVKDSLNAMKDHIQAIKLAIRRRDSTMILNKVNGYVRFGRKADKEIKKCLRSLKKMEDKHVGDNEMSAEIRILMEVEKITVSFLQAVSSFFTRQTKPPKSSRWSFYTKAMSKRKVSSEGVLEEAGNVVTDLVILSPCANSSEEVDGEKAVNAQSQLQILEGSIEGLEGGLDCLFRQLIQLRVSLLNLLNP